LPLSITATDEGMAITALVVDLAATGFKISGTTRNGVGGSIAYNVALRRGLEPDRNINWGFYKAGWAFSVIAGLTNVLLQLGGSDMDDGFAGTVSIISLTSSITADVMWTVGVINSLKYTRNAAKNSNSHSSLSIAPTYSLARKSVGAVAALSF
jgi:hypothetical protein